MWSRNPSQLISSKERISPEEGPDTRPESSGTETLLECAPGIISRPRIGHGFSDETLRRGSDIRGSGQGLVRSGFDVSCGGTEFRPHNQSRRYHVVWDSLGPEQGRGS